MSRSHRKTSIAGIACAKSEKRDKQMCNRKLRAKARRMLSLCDYHGECGCVMPVQREVVNIYTMAKDGKCWFDKNKYPKMMRK